MNWKPNISLEMETNNLTLTKKQTNEKQYKTYNYKNNIKYFSLVIISCRQGDDHITNPVPKPDQPV